LLNIPARFKFENDLNVRRPEGKLSAAEIDSMMVDAWKEYYKDDVDRLDEVGIFSATKLHFYIPTLSFYNFPYTFGWLFSLGVLAQRDRVGADSFGNMYRSLLRDTGRLTAEEVVEKHIGGKITETEFWNRAIDLVRQQVDEFEGFAAELGHVAK
jgi:oligoendopeptidase F